MEGRLSSDCLQRNGSLYEPPRRGSQEVRRSTSAKTIKRFAERDAAYRAVVGSNPGKLPASPRPPRTMHAGPVIITRPDGTSEKLPALSPSHARALAKERVPVSITLRARVLRRDRGTCRYCGDIYGPFEIDHVVPVSIGGPTAMRNLVTACRDCNQRKGARVWKPRPL